MLISSTHFPTKNDARVDVYEISRTVFWSINVEVSVGYFSAHDGTVQNILTKSKTGIKLRIHIVLCTTVSLLPKIYVFHRSEIEGTASFACYFARASSCGHCFWSESKDPFIISSSRQTHRRILPPNNRKSYHESHSLFQ
jgi:hypothetical protein